MLQLQLPGHEYCVHLPEYLVLNVFGIQYFVYLFVLVLLGTKIRSYAIWEDILPLRETLDSNL